MKKYLLFLLMALGGLWQACTKDTDGRPQVGPGNPVMSRILPDSGSGGSLVTIEGSGLGDMRSIVFSKDSMAVGFMPTLNTETAIIFRVPTTAVGGQQNILLTNSAGNTLSVPFRVLAYPSVTSASDYLFVEGSQLTLTGNNLDDVTAVALADSAKGISNAATIVSKSKTQLVVKMPTTALTRGKLEITNATGRMRTQQEFINKTLGYVIFDDAYRNSFADASWGDAAAVSTKEMKNGTAGIGKNYQKGNWHLLGFSAWSKPIAYSADYTYLTGWVRGASADYSLYVTTDASAAGFGNYVEANRIDVKAGEWHFFKIKLSDMDFWASGKQINQIGFRIKGPDKQDETFYFDDLMLVK